MIDALRKTNTFKEKNDIIDNKQESKINISHNLSKFSSFIILQDASDSKSSHSESESQSLSSEHSKNYKKRIEVPKNSTVSVENVKSSRNQLAIDINPSVPTPTF